MYAQHFAAGAYIVLLLALVFFVALSAVSIFYLKRELRHSQGREKHGTFFSHTYILAQDEERSRISRELHDVIIQDMRFLLLETEKIANTEEKSERETLSGTTIQMMAELIRKTREICNGLIPPDFRFSELPDALRQLCHNFWEKTGINCRAEIDSSLHLEFLTLEKRLQVFRIVQEALANIEKHSDAKEAIVTMRQTAESGQASGAVFVGISDDGRGFVSPLDSKGQIKTAIDKSHMGIVTMKERAAILGGRLTIESEIGEGALLCLEIPVDIQRRFQAQA